jgi:hypothetical protein
MMYTTGKLGGLSAEAVATGCNYHILRLSIKGYFILTNLTVEMLRASSH